MDRNNKSFSITEISANDSNVVDPKLIAEYLNDCFVNIGLKMTDASGITQL